MRRIFSTIFVMVLVAVASGFIHSSSSKLPQLFKGMNAEYEFSGHIATSDDRIVYNQTSRSNWTVLDLNETTASVEADFTIVLVEGAVPEPVAAEFNPFPSESWTQKFEFDLSESAWSYYLSDVSDELMKYKVGEEVVDCNVGSVDTHHLRLSRPAQQWDSFFDKSSGILISLQETISYSGYEAVYGFLIVDTNAPLSLVSKDSGGFIDIRFLILGVVVAALIVIILIFLIRRRRRGEGRHVSVSVPMQIILSHLRLASGENERL